MCVFDARVVAEGFYCIDKISIAFVVKLPEVELVRDVVPHINSDYLVVVRAVERYLLVAVLFVVG